MKKLNKIVAALTIFTILFSFSDLATAAGPVAINPIVSLTDAASDATYDAVATDGQFPRIPGSAYTFNIKLKTALVSGNDTTVRIDFDLKNPIDLPVDFTLNAISAPAANVSVTSNVTSLNVNLAVGADLTAAAVSIGTITFTSTMGGRFKLTSSQSVTSGLDTIAGKSELDGTSGKGAIYFSGTGAATAISGRGTSTATGVKNGIATFKFATIRNTGSEDYRLFTSGYGSIVSVINGERAPASITTISGVPTDYSQGVTVTTTADNTQNEIVVSISTVFSGVQQLYWQRITPGTLTPVTIAIGTLTWVEKASAAVSPQFSHVHINTGTVLADATNDKSQTKIFCNGLNVGVQCANILLDLRDGLNNPLSMSDLSIIVTGPGLAGLDATSNTNSTVAPSGRGFSVETITGGTYANQATITFWPDGTTGDGKIEIFAGSTLVAARTVTFYGLPNSIVVVTQNLSIAPAMGTGGVLGLASANPSGLTVSTTPAVTLKVLDEKGNLVPGVTLDAIPADRKVISGASFVESNGAGAGDLLAGQGYYNMSVTPASNGVSGANTDLVVRTLITSTGKYVESSPIYFSLGADVVEGSAEFILDKSEYGPGDKAKLTVKLTDKYGFPVFDQDLNIFETAGGGPVFSKEVMGTLPTNTATTKYISGSHVYDFYSPAYEGDFTFNGSLNPILKIVKAETSITTAKVIGPQTKLNLKIKAIAEKLSSASKKTSSANDSAKSASQKASDAKSQANEISDGLKTSLADLQKQLAALKKQLLALQKKTKK